MTTTIYTNARAKQWDERFFEEYVRANQFARYMGTTDNSVIQVNERLGARKGDTINCPLISSLRGTANDGTTQLVGNEKPLLNDAWGTTVRTVRDAVVIDMDEQQASPFNVRNAARSALSRLSTDYLRFDIIQAMDDRTGSRNIAQGAGGMSEDQWNAANDDRAFYGDGVNKGAASFQAGLDGIGAGATMSASIINEAKVAAKKAGLDVNGANDRNSQSRIRPIRLNEDEEWYVLFVSTDGYKNLQQDPVMQQANRDAWQRYGGQARTGGSGGNPLFRGGDLVYDGVIVREVTELRGLPGLTGTTAGAIDRAFLCGAQALTCAWAQRTRTTMRKEDDYSYQYGVGFSELRGVSKIHWENATGATGLVQWGMVSIYCALA